MSKQITLTRNHLEIYNPCQKDNNDRRKKITKAVFSYFDEQGVEYRRGFTAKPNTSEINMWLLAPEKLVINI
jgi:hypothetical protein